MEKGGAKRASEAIGKGYKAAILRNEDGTVAFMEVGAEFADALMYMLQCPLGSVIADLKYEDSPDLLKPAPPIHGLLKSITSLRPQIFRTQKEVSVPTGLFNEPITPSSTQTGCPFPTCRNKPNPHQGYQNRSFTCSLHGTSEFVSIDGNTGPCPFYTPACNCRRCLLVKCTTLQKKQDMRATFKETLKFIMTNNLELHESGTITAFQLIAKSNSNLSRMNSEDVYITSAVMKEMIGRAFQNSHDILTETFPERKLSSSLLSSLIVS